MATPSTDPLMLPQLEKVGGAQLLDLQKRCLALMQHDGDAKKFPGAQPVSFERKHLQGPQGGREGPSLAVQPYFAAEKTDGVRYMLLILGAKGTFTVDRNFDMKRLPPMRFPARGGKLLEGTLLDGELVVDEHAAKRKRDADGPDPPTLAKLRYLAYDSCRIAGRLLCEETLRTRLLHLRREVLSPRYVLGEAEPTAFDGELFSVEQKDFFTLPQLPYIFSHVKQGSHDSRNLYEFHDPLRRLSHGNDGIIFTPARDPYRPYTCPSLLKWKPANMNSIDFRLSTKWRREADNPKPQPRFFLRVASQTALMDYTWITFAPDDHARFSADGGADNKIIECVYDPSWPSVEYNPDDSADNTWDHPRHVTGGWKYERIREDKKLPNDISTVRSIEISVRDGVTGPELLSSLGLATSAATGGAAVKISSPSL